MWDKTVGSWIDRLRGDMAYLDLDLLCILL